MENNIQTYSVAIADSNHNQRLQYERLIKGEIDIILLTDVAPYENETVRIKLLNPQILVVNLNQCNDEDYAFLLSLRRECPDANMILLADNSIQDSQILQFLQIGARGYLKYEDVQLNLASAIRAVGRGEAWVPRKILGNITDHMLKL